MLIDEAIEVVENWLNGQPVVETKVQEAVVLLLNFAKARTV